MFRRSTAACTLALALCCPPLLLVPDAIAQAEQPAAAQPAPQQPPTALPPATQEPVPVAPAVAAAPAPAPPPSIRFNFKGATLDQVIDFFSRTTGLPVVKETDVPAATIDFLSPQAYDLPEALRVLNIILQSRGVMLRLDGDMLHLQKLANMKAENIPTFQGTLPENITDDQIVTVVRPLDKAMAKPMAEKLKDLVAAEYGAVTSIDQQNALVITETAGNVRRLLRIVGDLDREDPEGVVQIFSLKHAKAKALMEPVKALMGQKVQKFVINQQGQQVKIEEEETPGLSISYDERTNTIIGKGQQNKIEKLAETVRLLDVPAAGERRAIRTFNLEQLKADDAAARLNQLFEKVPAENKPVILADAAQNRVTLIGNDVTAADAEALMRELDGGAAARVADGAPEISVIALSTAKPQAVIAALSSLLSPRQSATTKLVTGPDDKSIIISGRGGDVAAISSLIPVLDKPGRIDREVRQLKLTHLKPAALVAVLQALPSDIYQPDAGSPLPAPVFDALDRLDLLVVSADAKQQQIIASLVQSLDVPQPQALPPLRILQLRVADAPALAGALQRQYDQRSEQEKAERPVRITGDGQTNALIIAANDPLFAEISALVEELNKVDRRTQEGREIRIFPLKVARAEELAKTIDEMYPQPPVPIDNRGRPLPHLQQPREVVVRADPQTNSLIVDAGVERMAGFEKLVEQLDSRKAVNPSIVRTYQVRHADLNSLARTLQQLAQSRSLSPSGEDRRTPITIATDDASRTLVVTGPQDVFERVELLLTELDVKPAAPATELRLFTLQRAKAEPTAEMLREVLTARLREEMPPSAANLDALLKVTPDRKTNTLIISAPPSILAVAEILIHQLDSGTVSNGDPVIRVRPLQFADAAKLVAALNQALTGMTSQTTGEPMSAKLIPSPGSNAIVMVGIDADLKEIDALIVPLDVGQAVDKPQVRTVMLKHARAETVAPIVQDLLGAKPLLALDQVPPWARLDLALALQQQQQEQPGGEVRVAADQRLNAVIISAVPSVLTMAEQMVEQLDVDPVASGNGGTALRAVRVLTVENADAGEIAANLEAVFAENEQTEAPPVIRVDAASNSLIVRGTDAQFATINQLVSQIDKATIAATRQMRLVPIDASKANAADVAATLQRLLDRGGGSSVEVLDVDDLIKRRKAAPKGSSSRATTDPGATASDQRESAVVLGARRAPHGRLAALAGRGTPLSFASPIAAQLATLIIAADPKASGGDTEPPVSIAVDPATNSLIILGPDRAVNRLVELAQQIQQQLPAQPGAIRYINLPEGVNPQTLQQLLTQMLQQYTPAGGARGDLAQRIAIIPDPTADALIVAGNDADFETVGELIALLARPADAMPVRTITLEKADAATVAAAIQKFYDDRAKVAADLRGSRVAPRRISIIGDPNSNTLLIAADQRDFDEVKTLVAQFDTQQASRALDFRVFPLKHAKATDIEGTVTRLVSDLTWNQGPFFWMNNQFQGPRQQNRGTLAIRADGRLNALIATGEGDKFAIVEKLIEVLDAPAPANAQREVRLYRVQHADLNTVAEVVRESFTVSDRRRWWEPPNPHEVQVRTDDRTKTLIVSGPASEQDEIKALIASIDVKPDGADQQMQVVSVEFARAQELAGTLRSFLNDRAAATNAPKPTATIVASPSANTLLISAPPEELAMLRDLLSRLDQPGITSDRVVEIIALSDGRADEVARIVREQFTQRGGQPGGAQGVVITSDVRTNSLIVNAPKALFAQVKALIDQLDAPRAADETIIRTYALEGARADEAVRILRETLQLDARGETRGITIRAEGAPGAPADAPAVEVKARVVADRRSNSLIVTATEQSFPVIEALIAKLDRVPAASPVEYRILPLKHAAAADVAITLRGFTRGTGPGGTMPDGGPSPRIDYNRFENELIIAATPDQFKEIQKVLAEIDQPSQTTRQTDFVPLKFAEAEPIRQALSVFYGPLAIEADTPGKQNVRIVADPNSNSLIISADETEWEGIRALLARLDNEEYDSSLQLKVLPLVHADARSVATAINEAFRGEIDRGLGDRGFDQQRRASQVDQDGRRDDRFATVTIPADEWVRASAEPLTNSVVVSASRQKIEKIEQIVTQLDQPDFAKLPPPQIIPVTSGNPEQIATALKAIYEQATDGQRTSGGGRKALRIVGDKSANVLIVRADEAEFAQIKALAETIQQQATAQGVSVRVISLKSAPARRIASAITDAFKAKAQQSNLPLSIQVDPVGNSIVVASSGPMFEEINATVQQMDAMAPPPGQAIFIIELENIAPDAARRVIETIGLDKPQADQSSARIVSEPIRVSTLAGRNALIVVANPSDRETIVGLLKAIDSEPKYADATVRVVKLHKAQAQALAAIINQILAPPEQPQSDNDLARAIREQVRRLAVRRDGAAEPDLKLDLTKPARVTADPGSNSLIISSTAENVAAIEQVVKMFDELPITDAVTVQLFPLQNIAADQFVRIVKDIFTQGKRLGQIPGTKLVGLPGGVVGKALLDEIAISADTRTNTVIVAGKEDAVALVEVLSKRIDSEIGTGWLEPRVLALRYADAIDLAATLQAIIVDGAKDLPESAPLQLQVGRLRMARMQAPGPDGGPPKPQLLEADVFQPMTRLVIRADDQLNALILVGTPANLEVVTELVKMLDIEAAAPEAAVRIYPLKHASATRLAGTITRLFDQQVQSKSIRPEDRVAATPDERTNALIVSTSNRSFVVLEKLLQTLDTDVAPELNEIRRVELKNASAARLAGMIQQLMDARLERLRKVAPETADLERSSIVADARTNSLVVAAGTESFEIIKKLAADLDSGLLGDASMVHVISMTTGNVDRIAATINQIMQRRYADLPGDLGRSQRPLVLTDPRSNSLLIAANPEDIAAISDLVTKLEAVPNNPAVGVHVLSAESMRAEQLAPRLQQLMRERTQTLGEALKPSDRVSVEADPASNSLIVAASEENMEVIRGLVAALATAEGQVDVGGEFEVIQLVTSRAADVLDMVNSLYVTEENRRRGGNAVRVSADRRLNALLVSASENDIRAIKALVAQLDGAKPMTVVEIRYLPLRSANALETVSLIENILSGRGIDGRRGQQATVLKYLREIAKDQTDGKVGDEQSEMEVSAAIRESITLTPDLRTNTIIVSAPRQSMKMIEQMIRDLDESSTGSQNIRIFKLVNADAVAMAEIVSDLFNLRREGELYVLKPREAAQTDAGAMAPVAAPGPSGLGAAAPGAPEGFAGLGGTELTAVPDPRQQLAITVDSRTNSLLVSGTPNYLDLVAEVVKELDSLQANERLSRVYRLNNAVAADVARVVGGFIKEEQQKLVSTLSVDQRGSAARMLEREITIVGDEKSNSVLISSSPRYMEQVQQMVSELDVDPPQVLIQVLLAEVTLDSQLDWGVDLQTDSSIDGVSIRAGYGLASAFITGMGVPTLAISSSDFDLVIKALEAQGRLQVLSNPSVMAANNQPARIQIGETIQIPSTTSITEGGTQQTSVQSEDIGVILEVTPSINPGGFVRMDIAPQISELSSRTTQINENFNAPIITRRAADTTVTVKDGQTIVLGGLISDRYERRENKVPILGDIPLLGLLFRNDLEKAAKTELLIVMTPHVVMSPAEVDTIDKLRNREIDRLSVPPAVRDSIRLGQPRMFDPNGKLIDQKQSVEFLPPKSDPLQP